MKFSFDLDGTYLDYPEMFDGYAFILQSSGHEVGILTNRPDGNGIDYGFEPDFEIYLGNHEDDTTPQERAFSKTEAMLENGIDQHYDDEADMFPDYVNVISIGNGGESD